jgi:hypothetical protein
MPFASLTVAPCHQIVASTKRRAAFWLRVDESVLVPTNRPEAPLTIETVYQSAQVRLQRYLMGKRSVFYTLVFTRAGKLPRTLQREWYVQAYYGTRVGSLRVLYDDGQVRLVGGGRGNAYIFVYLRLGRAELPTPDSESVYRSNL